MCFHLPTLMHQGILLLLPGKDGICVFFCFFYEQSSVLWWFNCEADFGLSVEVEARDDEWQPGHEGFVAQ